MIARQLESRDELVFTGELASDVVAGGSLLRDLARVNSSFSALAEAINQPARVPTIGDLIGAGGFRILFLELTGRCNERCEHCYASSAPEVAEALDPEQILMVLSQARGLGFETVQLTGGDPLISPHLELAVKESHRLGFHKIEVYTNGLAFNAYMADLFHEFRVCMALSLYSHAPEVHDAVTNTPGSHARTSRAIQLAVSRGITVRVGGVQGIHDAQDETALRKYVHGLGLKDEMIAMDVQREVGRGAWNAEAQLLPGRARGHNSPSDREKGRLCVTYSGNIVPCIFDRSTVLGHVGDTSLSEALSQTCLPRADGERRKLGMVRSSLSCPSCQFRHQLLHEAI